MAIDPELAAWGMANSPQFAQYMQGQRETQQAASQGRQLAQASKGVEQFIANNNIGRQKAFKDEQLSQGPVPEAQMAMNAPALSGIEQFNERRRAMMQSANPALQEQAMAMQRTGYKPPAAPDNPNSYEEYIRTTAQPSSEGYQKFLQEKQKASGTTIKMGADGQHIVGDIVPDDVKVRYGFRPEDTVIWGKEGPKILDITSMAAGDAGKAAMTKTALEQIPVYKEHMYSPDGTIDQDVIKAMAAMNTFGKYTGPAIGVFSPELRQRAEDSKAALMTGMMSITRTETGAAMAEEEIKHTMERFWPQATDGASVQAQKLRAYEYFLTNVESMLDPKSAQNRGLKPKQIADRAAAEALSMQTKEEKVAPSFEGRDVGDTWKTDAGDKVRLIMKDGKKHLQYWKAKVKGNP